MGNYLPLPHLGSSLMLVHPSLIENISNFSECEVSQVKNGCAQVHLTCAHPLKDSIPPFPYREGGTKGGWVGNNLYGPRLDRCNQPLIQHTPAA